MRGIGRLEGRVEQFLAHQARTDERMTEHDHRISALEEGKQRTRGYIAGAAAVGSAVAAGLGFLAKSLGLFG